MTAEQIALIGLLVGVATLAGSWWISGRSGAHATGKTEATVEAIEAQVEELATNSRLAWTTLREEVERWRCELNSEIDTLRTELSARDHRMWDRFDLHATRIATVEANGRSFVAALERLDAMLRTNGRG